ncbi:ribosomal protein S12 methylthiotransferase [Lachnospiraceae bacterium NE2001]|nr:ribosomal protein S12 methylthiotransferase [Lachnospiraceae bacterium NE2001]
MLNILLVTLGCDKNTADSERMLGLIDKSEYNLVSDPEVADVAIVNTCCFIESATQESIDKLLELAAYKEGRLKYLICTGCMAQRFKDQIVKELPEVDAFVGTMSLDSIVEVISELELSRKQANSMADESGINGEVEIALTNNENDGVISPILKFDELDAPYPDRTQIERIVTERPYLEYLKIADGCDKRCTYCAIPYFKGKYKSVPMESVIEEAKVLAASGVKELILVAQETTCYGIDLYGEKRLHILLRELSKIDGIEWIRLLYAYPEEIYPELISEMSSNPKVLHYIDMPIQHTEDDILRRMGRRIDNAGIRRVVNELRINMPDIIIRSTIITGFPGETIEEHEKLLDTLAELGLDHVGVFTYSQEDGTPAATFDGQIDEDTKNERLEDIMLLQQDISAEKLSTYIDKAFNVIIDGYLPDDDVYVGRSYMDAPDIDGMVFIDSPRELISGEIVRVKITDSDVYDLEARLI